MREVRVTGIGAVCAFGIGVDALVRGVRSGEPALGELPFDALGFPFTSGGVVPGLKPKQFVARRKDLKLMSRDARLAVAAAVLAVEDAGLEEDEALGLFFGVGYEKGEVDDVLPALHAARDGEHLSVARLAEHGLAMMNPLSSLKTLPNMPLAHVAIRLGARGPNLALSPDAAAAELAIDEAWSAVAQGECDRALAGGADCLTSLAGFSLAWRLGALADGLPPGEGAAFLVLEAADAADAAEARAYTRAERPVDLDRWIGHAGAAAPALAEAAAWGLGGRP